MKHQGVVVAGGFALAVLAFAPVDARAQTTREVSRSSPIIAEVGGVEAQYQGTFEITTPAPPVTTFNGAADAATFEFPYTLGHLRAVRTTDLPAVETAFDDLIDTFDTGDPAATLIPTPNPAGCGVLAFTSGCRTVFTTVAAPDAAGLAQRPTRIPFDTANLAALKPLLAPALGDPDVTTLIGRVLAGVPDGSGGHRARLGGIDRSTLAIIEASPFIPQIAGVDRPTMIYVGALDGMLHAICAEVLGPCLQEGQELWAFIPRTQLGQLRFNTQRVNGTVKVADVFDDFNLTDGVLLREFRTVLTFQTGSGDALANNLEPSVLALDVSNPADPIVLWERSTPSIAAPVMQGVGLNLAMGQVRVGGVVRNFTFAQSNNGANATDSGFYLAAIDTSTGVEEWSFQHLYPDPRTVGNPEVPDSGIPGGAAAFDLDQSGLITHVAVTSLYGDLWVFPAAVAPPVTSEPIFRFSEDFQPIGAPPTIYFDQFDRAPARRGRLRQLRRSGGRHMGAAGRRALRGQRDGRSAGRQPADRRDRHQLRRGARLRHHPRAGPAGQRPGGGGRQRAVRDQRQHRHQPGHLRRGDHRPAHPHLAGHRRGQGHGGDHPGRSLLGRRVRGRPARRRQRGRRAGGERGRARRRRRLRRHRDCHRAQR